MTVQTPEMVIASGEHVVQFYDDDCDLARAVGDYLIRAVCASDAAVVVATEAHRLAFEAELIGAGIDVPKACRDGSLVWLDAASLLATFVSDGQLDGDSFRAVIGGIVRQAADTGRQIRAYGEMVALLWDAGDVLGAIEVEKLWNELAGELRFSLWCAYHSESVASHEHAEAVHEVCDLHSSVVDNVTARFEAGGDAPSAAREFVASLLDRRPYGRRAPSDDAQLVVSELATNAVIHARSPFSVSVRCDGSALRISIRDASPARPAIRNGGPAAVSGRGLRLVDTVARDWGVEAGPDGKTVWAELTLR